METTTHNTENCSNKTSVIWNSSIFIWKLCSYLTTNTDTALHCKDQPINSHYANDWCLCWELQEAVNTLWVKCWGLNGTVGGTQSDHKTLKSYLTPGREFLEKIAVSQLVKKYPRILCNLEVYYLIHLYVSSAR